MNIKITYNWLLEYLDTDATPDEMQKYLSLCGPSIEKVDPTSLRLRGVNKIGNSTKGGLTDYVFDIEITSNRIDTASVIGIAQEAQAILPMFGKKAKLKLNPLTKYKFDNIVGNDPRVVPSLKIKIVDATLCPRFTAIVLENIKIAPSPDFIRERLIACGIKSINNVIDISNYLMLALGQPVHVFDYDQIKNHMMIIRESKKGEKIITLDEKEVVLPGGDIVIEDGLGRLIDLCGIMGGLNSAISEKTKNVVLFVQTYDKVRIRKTSMSTGIRTVAAAFFEKGLDPERVEPTLVYGVELLEKYASAKVSSKLYDIYPTPKKEKLLVMGYELFGKKIGVKIPEKTINSILNNLGFGINHLSDDRTKMVKIIVPSWRANDIDIPEDIVEEITRVYGYQNIPSVLQSIVYVDQPKDMEDIFVFQNKIKLLLKHLGLNEVINYSMVSKEQLEAFNLDPKKHLRLSNSLSKDIEYLRTCLTISLFKNIKDNAGKTRHNTAPGEKEILRFFEIGKTYQPKNNDLPDEIYKIGIATNTDYFDLKGIVEAIYKELNIDVGNKNFCSVPDIIKKDGIFMVEIDFQLLIDNCQLVPKYQPINPYAVIKLDKTFEISPKTTYEVVRQKAFQSKLLRKIEVVTLYQNKLTLRFYYSSTERNITEEEAKGELDKLD